MSTRTAGKRLPGLRTSRSSFAVALSLVALGGLFTPQGHSSSTEVGIAVGLREWLLLEVTTTTEKSLGEGSPVSIVHQTGEGPVAIRALVCVGHDQTVRLQVEASGDPIDDRGGGLAVAETTWRSHGPGFVAAGWLDRGRPQVLASWTGPGLYEGSVELRFPDQPGGNRWRQTLVYSLVMP